jgi:hypothetical protein
LPLPLKNNQENLLSTPKLSDEVQETVEPKVKEVKPYFTKTKLPEGK